MKVLLAKDIPGINNTMPAPYAPEELLCSGQVLYAGQAVAIVVAGQFGQSLFSKKCHIYSLSFAFNLDEWFHKNAITRVMALLW